MSWLTKNDPLRTGIVGYGKGGKIFHAPIIQALPEFCLKAVASSSASRVHEDWPEVEVVSGIDELLDDDEIDLVIIETPNFLHYEQARKSLEAGKHVIVDKPFTITVAEAIELRDVAKEKDLFLSVYHNRRWDGDFITIRQALEKKILGDIVVFESHFDSYTPKVSDKARDRETPGAGTWYDLGPHLIDQALCLFGMPEKVFLDTAVIRPEGVVTDYFHAILIYAGHRVILHSSKLDAAKTPRFLVQGTKGSLVKYNFDPQEGLLMEGKRPVEGGAWGEDYRKGKLYLGDGEGTITCRDMAIMPDNYSSYYRAVAKAIREGGENPVSPDEAIMVMEVLEAGLKSAEEGRTIGLK